MRDSGERDIFALDDWILCGHGRNLMATFWYAGREAVNAKLWWRELRGFSGNSDNVAQCAENRRMLVDFDASISAGKYLCLDNGRKLVYTNLPRICYWAVVREYVDLVSRAD
jgi:hypothetical protein